MTTRSGVLALLALAAVPAPIGAQIRRVEEKGFPVALSPFVALSWGGKRADELDPATCTSLPCAEHKLGSTPQLGIDAQIPLGRMLGFGVVAAAGRPSRVICISGTCSSPNRVTAIHGAALILWRFKPRAPIFFGVGPSLSYVTPGPVHLQTEAVTEFGGSLVIGYDAKVQERLGLRVGWWNYFVKPDDAVFPAAYTAPGYTWDTMISLGVRYALGR